VKVAYRWQSGDNTNWARLAAPHAGNGRGIMFMPEVGDEVLVAFEQGDPERPVIIGSLWNGRDQPPEAEDDNLVKMIRTRSGLTITFRDEDRNETIDVSTPKGECVLQLKCGSSASDAIITLFSEGDIALEAKGEIRLKSKTFQQKVDSDSKRDIGGEESTKTGKDLTLQAGMNIGLAGGMNAALKGGMNVESVAGALNNVVGSMVHIQPPGFMAKEVKAKPVQVTEVDVGDREPPEEAEPKRTTENATPRGS
jgi:uncharacterized protein involved in type VI secretion and phage assembly